MIAVPLYFLNEVRSHLCVQLLDVEVRDGQLEATGEMPRLRPTELNAIRRSRRW